MADDTIITDSDTAGSSIAALRTALQQRSSTSSELGPGQQSIDSLFSDVASELRKCRVRNSGTVAVAEAVTEQVKSLLRSLSELDAAFWSSPDIDAAAGAELLEALVALYRRNEGLDHESAALCTACANALLNACLAERGKQRAGRLAADLPDTLRHVYHAIAVGVIEAEGSDEEPDPMAPLEIGRVFDAYSASYDESMRTLQYSVPNKVAAWVADHPGKWQLVADLGCGTGLMGKVVRESCEHLAGCDISPGMVISASQLDIYDDLRVQDCCNFLASFPSGSVDLVIAADVVEYIGDVADLFAKAASALRTAGELIVSAESLEESSKRLALPDDDCCREGYLLLPSERFAHTATYLQAAADSAGLETSAVLQLDCLREEEGESLAGWLCFLRKT